jgi:hypothetical protein
MVTTTTTTTMATRPPVDSIGPPLYPDAPPSVPELTPGAVSNPASPGSEDSNGKSLVTRLAMSWIFWCTGLLKKDQYGCRTVG